MALLRGKLLAGALFAGALFGTVAQEAAENAGGWGWIGHESPSRESIARERIRLGITQDEAKKLQRVIRIAGKTKKAKANELPNWRELAEADGMEWREQFQQWLYILERVIEQNRNSAAEKKLLYALEQWNVLRIENEELDVAFLISMLAAEIYA